MTTTLVLVTVPTALAMLWCEWEGDEFLRGLVHGAGGVVASILSFLFWADDFSFLAIFMAAGAGVLVAIGALVIYLIALPFVGPAKERKDKREAWEMDRATVEERLREKLEELERVTDTESGDHGRLLRQRQHVEETLKEIIRASQDEAYTKNRQPTERTWFAPSEIEMKVRLVTEAEADGPARERRAARVGLIRQNPKAVLAEVEVHGALNGLADFGGRVFLTQDTLMVGTKDIDFPAVTYTLPPLDYGGEWVCRVFIVEKDRSRLDAHEQAVRDALAAAIPIESSDRAKDDASHEEGGGAYSRVVQFWCGQPATEVPTEMLTGEERVWRMLEELEGVDDKETVYRARRLRQRLEAAETEKKFARVSRKIEARWESERRTGGLDRPRGLAAPTDERKTATEGR